MNNRIFCYNNAAGGITYYVDNRGIPPGDWEKRALRKMPVKYIDMVAGMLSLIYQRASDYAWILQ